MLHPNIWSKVKKKIPIKSRVDLHSTFFWDLHSRSYTRSSFFWKFFLEKHSHLFWGDLFFLKKYPKKKIFCEKKIEATKSNRKNCFLEFLLKKKISAKTPQKDPSCKSRLRRRGKWTKLTNLPICDRSTPLLWSHVCAAPGRMMTLLLSLTVSGTTKLN